MKKLIPLMALLVFGASFSASPALAGGHGKCPKKCEKGSADDCCKEEGKAKSEKKTEKAKEGEGESKEKPAESK